MLLRMLGHEMFMWTQPKALHSQCDCTAQRRRWLWHKTTMLVNFPMAATERSNETTAHGRVPGHLAWWNRTVSLHRRESTDQLLKQESTPHHASLFTQIIDVNLWEPCVLYIGRAYCYPPDVAFYIFFFNKYKYWVF